MGRRKSNKQSLSSKLSKLYFDPRQPGSYGGKSKFLKSLRASHPKLSVSKATEWLSSKETYSLHRDSERNGVTRQTMVSGIDSLWQGDLTDLPDLKADNDGYRYILFIIDVFSKYLYAIPLKTKTATSVSTAFTDILNRTRKKPSKFQTDRGTEFTNKTFQDVLTKNKILYYNTHNYDKKATVVERVQRTLKEKMFRFFTRNNTRRYIDVLEDLVSSYNMTHHRSIGRPPADVNTDNQEDVWHTLYGSNRSTKISKNKTFERGDPVRIIKERRVFTKGYLPKWTREVFTVTNRRDTNPPVYELIDENGEKLTGTWYHWELQKIPTDSERIFRIKEILGQRLLNGVAQYYVSWDGYPDSFNSYINKRDIIHNYKD